MSEPSAEPTSEPKSEAHAAASAEPRRASLIDYLRLMRLPNVFTAVADILMGFAFVRGGYEPLGQLLLLIAASAALYTAGMVLNDVFDIEIDRRERPQRPLPSGRIGLRRARSLGFALLTAGCVAAVLAAIGSGGGHGRDTRALSVAAALALAIVAYDGYVKRTFLGPWNMGLCRLLNVWLGMAAADTAAWPAWQPDGLCVAGGIGLYIAGVTWFARREAETSPRWGLAAGFVIMLLGWGLLGMLPYVTDKNLSLREPLHWQLLLVMLGLPLLRRCLVAIATPTPQRVQGAVKHGIMTLIFMDAAVVFNVASLPAALVVLGLLAPMLLLGRWVYST